MLNDDDVFDDGEEEEDDLDADDELDDDDMEPDDEDVFADDSGGPFRYLHKVVARTQDELREWMEKEGYFPNVWVISDHGNAHLLELDE